MFASAGSDCTVRVYDESTCTTCRTLDHGDGVTSHGHSNHVFSLAWQPDDPQVGSGGWAPRHGLRGTCMLGGALPSDRVWLALGSLTPRRWAVGEGEVVWQYRKYGWRPQTISRAAAGAKAAWP